ncbi:hypothetical protein [Caldisalinibacter kiritimatiensis]|nr:hypothetical protein [Caldisalinibacter kiritimatiensis]
MNKDDSNYVSLIRYILYVVLMITGVMTLINQENLVYMLIAVMVTSIFGIFTELLSQNKKLMKIVTNLVILILFTLVYINMR